jgi:hypothetical protein
VILIGYYSLIRTLIGRQGDPLPVGPGLAFHQGKILFTANTPASRSVIFIGYYSLIHALIGRQGDPPSVGPGLALHQGQDSLHT